MIINDLNLGPFFTPLGSGILQSNAGSQSGQSAGSVLIYGNKTSIWPVGSVERVRKETVYVEAPFTVANFGPGTSEALRYLIGQLRELSENSHSQAVYIQWRSGNNTVVSDLEDGWWIVKNIQPNMESEGSGWAAVSITAGLVAPGTPSSLASYFSGGALASTYLGASTNLIGFPVGSTNAPATISSRTGGEGAIPYSQLSASATLNPLPFTRPGTIAGLFLGGVKVYDTINTSSFAIPTAPGFVNSSWLQIYGTQHAFIGDCVITNGLLLLLIQPGTAGMTVYLWNTNLGTVGWDLIGTINYNDSSLNVGTIREINLSRVGYEEVRIRIVLGTSIGNYAMLKLKLQRAQYATYCEFWPLTENNSTGYGLRWSFQNSAKIAYDESSTQDLAVTTNAVVAASTTLGFGASFSKTANDPISGWLYQNPPSTAQGLGGAAATDYALGDASGPSQNSFRLYGFYSIPFVTAPNLQAEGESGALGTGWSSQVDVNASGGNTAQAASGTVSTNADLFGVSWVPPAGMYDVWFRVRVTSAGGSAAEMTLGLWDTTSSAFVTGASTTFRANQASTSYVWLKANSTTPVTPTAAHNMQFRAVTAATLGTNWFIDEAALVPIKSSSLGIGNFPGDIWSQWMFDKDVRWTRG